MGLYDIPQDQLTPEQDAARRQLANFPLPNIGGMNLIQRNFRDAGSIATGAGQPGYGDPQISEEILKTGVSKFDSAASPFNKSAYNYGYGFTNPDGSRSLAGQEVDRLGGLAAASQGRAGAAADYSRADADYGRELAARDAQTGALGLMSAAARGQAPSVAEQSYLRNLAAGQNQFGQQMGLMNAQAQSMANSARGGGSNLALAQRGAMNAMGRNAGLLASQQAAQARESAYGAGALRAQEMAAARGQYGDIANTLRGSDAASRGLSAQMGQYNAGLQNDQMARNDARELGYEGLRQDFAGRQQGAEIQKNLDANTQALEWERARKGLDAARMQRDASLFGSALNAAATLTGTAIRGGKGGGGS